MSLPDGPPVLRIVRGSATREELAALIAVVVARSAAAPPPAVPATAPSRWSYGVGLRHPLPAGPGAWRAVHAPGAH